MKFDAINLDGEHGVWSAVEVDQHVALANALGMSVYVSPHPPVALPLRPPPLRLRGSLRPAACVPQDLPRLQH
eukprot:COSAG04_NODE_100_length_26314_cov_36.469044_13_plen_73_part_00